MEDGGSGSSAGFPQLQVTAGTSGDSTTPTTPVLMGPPARRAKNAGSGGLTPAGAELAPAAARLVSGVRPLPGMPAPSAAKPQAVRHATALLGAAGPPVHLPRSQDESRFDDSYSRGAEAY